MNPANLATPFLRAEINRLAHNIARRASRIRATGTDTSALREFDAVVATNPGNRQGLIHKAAELNRINNLQGSRRATAARVAHREVTAAHNAELRRALTIPQQLSRMTDSQLKEATALGRADLRKRLSRVRTTFGESYTTHKAEQYLAMRPTTRQQRLSLASKLGRTRSWKTLTATGAREQLDRGIQLFGEEYRNWDNRQQAAVWDEVHEMAERDTMSSSDALNVVSTVVTSGMQVKFTTDDDGSVHANIATTMDEAVAQAARDENDRKLRERIIRSADNNPAVWLI